MKIYETSATVEDQGRVRLAGVPFDAGTEVDITISPKRRSEEKSRLRTTRRWPRRASGCESCFGPSRGSAIPLG
jgi:hypothetical protein